MQKIYFFNNPVGTQKISFVVSELKLDDLIKNDIIPKNSPVLVDDFKKYSGDESLSHMLTHVDKLKFDDYKNPKEVKFDINLLSFSMLEIYKEMRTEKLKDLDNLQFRAMARGLSDVVEMIEDDKERLRNMPKEFKQKAKSFKNHEEAINSFPREILKDYNMKYQNYLK